MTNPSPKPPGMPVLAYLTSEPLSLSCRMRILHNKDNSQISIVLHVAVTLEKAPDEQAFILQYDANALQPDGATMNSATTHTPSARRAEISRHAGPQLATLSLRLKHVCPVWCPRGRLLIPQASVESVTTFNEFLTIAKATTVHLVYDTKWLAKPGQTAIAQLVKAKKQLAAYPLDKYYAKLWVCKDWTVFAPTTAVQDAEEAVALHKRIRSASSPSSPSPPAKRQAHDPTPDIGLEEALYPPPSPTEAASTPPEYRLKATLPDPQTLNDLITAQLPAIFADTLPALLPTLFAVPDPSTNASSPSSDSTPPEPPTLTPLGALLIPHLLAHLAPQLTAINTASLNALSYPFQTARLSFEEEVEYAVIEVKNAVEEGVEELGREAGYALDEVRHGAAEVVNEIGERVGEKVGEEAWERVEGLWDELERAKRVVAAEWVFAGGQDDTHQQGVVEERCCGRCGRGAWGARGVKRMGKGGYRGLGRRWRRYGADTQAH